jgi:voltage-gated potassium channel
MTYTPGSRGYEWSMLVLSCYALAALAAQTLLPLPESVSGVLGLADYAVCAAFFVDFVISLRRAEHPGRYFLQWGWLDLLSSIPAIEAFRLARVSRLVRLIRVLRTIRAGRTIGSKLLERRAEGAFASAVALSLLLVVFASVAVLQFEQGHDIRSANDALWWAISTLTTVGYGDHVPVTIEGRLIAVLLMTAGVALFGVMSGLAATWFLAPARARQAEELEAIRMEIVALRQAVLPGSDPRAS